MKKLQGLRISIIVCVVMFFSLVSSFPVTAEENSVPIVPAESSHREGRSLLGSDDRRQMVPSTTDGIYSSIGRIISPSNKPGYVALGTGFVVGTNTIVTNNHVAENFKNAKVLNGNVTEDAWYYPGRDGNKTPFGRFKVIDVVFSPNTDIAVVTVGKQNDKPNGAELGDIVSPLVVKKFAMSDTHVTISGYPGEKNHTQWYHQNDLSYSNFSNTETPIVRYDIDTTGGQSGSPIYNDNQEVVGVHSNGGVKSTGNYGQRLNTTNYNFIVNRIIEETEKISSMSPAA